MSDIGKNDQPSPPFGWELSAAAVLCWLLVALMLLPAGQGLACVLTGGGWVWPGPNLAASVTGLVTGHTGRGLPASLARRVPTGYLVYTAIAACELTLGAVTGLGAWVWRREFADTRGWATRHDAQQALGADRLWRRRSEIRPDLYPTQPKRRSA